MAETRIQRWSLTRFALAGTAMVGGMFAAPLHAQNFSCASTDATTPTDAVNGLLNTLRQRISGAWGQASQNIIDPFAFQTGNVTASCPEPQGSLQCSLEFPETPYCDHVTAHFNVSTYTGLSQIGFSTLTLSSFNAKDVAAHSAWGSDAGKVTDGVFAPDGTTWNNPSFTVLLPLEGTGSAVTIDLGSVMTICGTTGTGGCGPIVQADRHDMQFDYLDDATSTWIGWGSTGELSGSGLLTRAVVPTQGTTGGNFTTRYVRLWPKPGADDSNFSVSEILLKNPAGTIVSTGKLATGPSPYLITDGKVPSDGTTWNDPNSAVVLRKDGPGSALVIDLGDSIYVCGSGTCQPSVSADKNVFQLDYSLDGSNWVPYALLPAASGDGLHNRPVGPLNSTTALPNSFKARYVRIWGCSPTQCPDSSNDDFSVAEVELNNTAGNDVSTNALTFGPEPLATNGESAPAGTEWNDPGYAAILSPCLSDAKYPCTQRGSTKPTTGALTIDLTASFPIQQIDFQGDRHQFQVDYLDGSSTWQPLWPIPASSDDGLSSRSMTFSAPTTARYLMVYGTAGDDSNYSVSSLQVYTAKAQTSCAYASGANSGQTFSCSYDGPMAAQLSTAAGFLAVQFTVDEASAYLRCTDGLGIYNSTGTVASIKGGTQCSAIMSYSTPAQGNFCSGSCSDSTSVLTYGQLSQPPKFVLDPNSLACNNITGDLTGGLITAVEAAAGQAVQQFFNQLPLSKNSQLRTPWIPSGACATTAEPSNSQLQGLATQVGSTKGNGHVLVSGQFNGPDPLALDALALTLEQVLFERGGVEELVRNDRRNRIAPMTLQPRNGSNSKQALYSTAPTVVPAVQAKIMRTGRGAYDYLIEIDRATLPTLPACTSGTAELATRFSLSAGGVSIPVRALHTWRCEGSQLRTP